MFVQDKIKQTLYFALVKLINFSNNVNSSGKRPEVNLQINTLSLQELKSQSTVIQQKLSDDCYKTNQQVLKYEKAKDLPRQRGEFSFDKNEFLFGEHLLSMDTNNMTAHFNRMNLMSRGKGDQEFTETVTRPNYHNHLMNEEAPEAFMLDPQFNTRNSITITGGHSRQESDQQLVTPQININQKDYHSQTLKMKFNIQNEISPTNNCKNYQRQAQLNKNYEQAEPFELPMTENELDIPKFTTFQRETEYNQFLDKYFDQKVVQKDQTAPNNNRPRYSKNVIPFNQNEETHSDTQLRQTLKENKTALNSQNIPLQQKSSQIFESKKTSQASNVSSQNTSKPSFINNYFSKLSSQNSANQENKVTPQIELQQKEQPQLQLSTPKSYTIGIRSHNHQVYQNHPQAQASFVTSNQNVDFMHFNSHSDTSFVFFDDNFWRDSGISSASRITNLGKLNNFHQNQHSINQSFGSHVPKTVMSNILRQALNNKQ